MKDFSECLDYQEFYQWGARILADSGVVESELDARLLLEEACHTDRNTLLVHGDRKVTEEEKTLYHNYILLKQKRTPIQYILGYTEFMGLNFTVNENVLIPRQDTEILVEEVLLELHDGMKILDMCTGSGCILISLLHCSNDCIGTGVDISDKALEVAKKNAMNNSVEAKFVESNLFEKVTGRYDIIVSNPPYICSGIIPTLMEEVKDFEPMLALDGTENGLFFYQEIIYNAMEHLEKGGWLFFEIGYDQGEAVSKLMRENNFIEVEVIKDLAGLDRVVKGKKGCLTD